jgi:hypothetical protein
MLSDDLLLSLNPQIQTSVIRKSIWIHEKLDYKKLYILFMMEKIKEAAIMDPFA